MVSCKSSLSVNTYCYKDYFDGKALESLEEIISAMNFNNGILVEDADYGRVPYYYIAVQIGRDDKPYELIN